MSVKSSHNLNSIENGQKEGKKRKLLSNGTAISDPLQDDNRSLGSTTDEEDFWASISANERSVKLLSNHRKGSLALNQILLDLKSEKNQPEEYDEYEDVDVKAIAAAISEELEGDDSEQSDSSGSGTVSEGSDLDDDSSDEESEHEVFDFENHINKLVKRENKSESASDNDSDSDGNESVNSEKVFKKAVEKAMKKIKRERSEEMVESDLESLKESETEDSPTSEDQSASEASDTEEENENAYKFQYLAPMLKANKVQNLRWPFSNLYVKELEQDPGMPLSDLEESLPSYRSTVATAFHPGRERNVMLGRVWWVEWWAKDDSRVGKYPDKSYLL